MNDIVERRLPPFERFLPLWILLCVVSGVLLGGYFPGVISHLRNLEFISGSQVNGPISVLIWLMILPMMLKVDFGSIGKIRKQPKGLLITLFVNWIVKPLSMAFLAWVFIRVLFLPLIGEELAREFSVGLILLAAAPCTAMVFVWSYLTNGDPEYTLVQVAVNDLFMLILFAPIVMLLSGVAGVVIPTRVLLTSVFIFIVIPLITGFMIRKLVLKWRGLVWLNKSLIPSLHPITILALLATLILIFAFQSENLINRWFMVFLLAVPITIQVYFNSGLAYLLMRLFRVEHRIAAPGALIGASNFFELSIAVAITLFGTTSGAALATIVGVLVEVPVMLSVCAVCNRTQIWYNRV